jgi:hypothetical protein
MSFKVCLYGGIKQVLFPSDYITTDGVRQLGQFPKGLGPEGNGCRFGIFSMSGVIAELPQVKPMLQEMSGNQSSPLCSALFGVVIAILEI